MNNISDHFLNKQSPSHKEAYAQLELLDKGSFPKRWVALGNGNFKPISFLPYLIEIVKGWLGLNNRAKSETLKANYLCLIERGINNNEFNHSDIILIQTVAKRVGIVPDGKDFIQLNYLIKIVKPIFENKLKENSEDPKPLNKKTIPIKIADLDPSKIKVIGNPFPLNPPAVPKSGEPVNPPNFKEKQEEENKQPKPEPIISPEPIEQINEIQDHKPEPVNSQQPLEKEDEDPQPNQQPIIIPEPIIPANVNPNPIQQPDKPQQDEPAIPLAIPKIIVVSTLPKNEEIKEEPPQPLVQNQEIPAKKDLFGSWLMIDENQPEAEFKKELLKTSSIAPIADTIENIKDEVYKNNVKFIVSFPENSAAKINSSDGKLAWNGKLAWQSYFSNGAEFHQTLQVIGQTLNTSEKIFKSLYEKALKSSQEEKIVQIRKAADKLIHVMNLSDGIKRILKNYPNSKELKDLVDKFDKSEQKIINDYSELVQQIKKDNEQELSESLISPKKLNNLKIEDASQSLSAFCSLYCENMESAETLKWISSGQTLMTKILNDSYKPPVAKDKSEEELTSLSWFMMFAAFKKKQGFEEGAFVIEDPDLRLYNYLKTSPGIGARASSHFVGRSPDNNNMSGFIMKSALHDGLDVLTGRMPAKKRTLDFTLFDAYEKEKKLLFIKPENYSPFVTTEYGYDFCMHGVELVEAQARKRLQKGGDDQPGMQKERIPDAVKETFGKIVDIVNTQKISLPEKFKRENLKKDANLWGIAFMFDLVKNLKSIGGHNQKLNEAIENFALSIQGLDHLENRTGREVFLSAQELQEMSKVKISSEETEVHPQPLLESIEEFIELSAEELSNSHINKAANYEKFYEQKNQPWFFDKMHGAFNTMSELAKGWMIGNLEFTPHPDASKAAGQRRLASPGVMLQGGDVKEFIRGISGNKPLNVIENFYVSRGINSYTLEDVKKLIDKQARTFIPGKPICIPVTFVTHNESLLEKITTWDRNHIALILIDGDTVEYYDSQGIKSDARKLLDGTSVKNILDYCKKTFGKKQLIENNQKQQLDAHNCGVFVCRLIYKRIIEKEPIGTINLKAPSNEELNAFRLKIMDIAYPPINEAVNEIISGKIDQKQIEKDLERLGSIKIRNPKDKSLTTIYENPTVFPHAAKKNSEQIYNAIKEEFKKYKVEKYLDRTSMLAAQTLLKDLNEKLNKIVTNYYLLNVATEQEKDEYKKDLETGIAAPAAIVKTASQYVTIEIDAENNLLYFETKLNFPFSPLANIERNLGYIIVKRSITIPLTELNTENLSAEVVDWYSDWIKNKADAECLLPKF